MHTIPSAEFTFAAWVDMLGDPSEMRIPILRKPMRTDQSLTCWGWFHAPEFRYGAHDFHSLIPMEVEASVSAGKVLEVGLTHEVLVLKGGVFTFYRNGKEVASVPIPRAITDCDGDVVLLGSPSLALASVSFYGRALLSSEISEMYVGGQPLSELATGSLLPQAEFDSTTQVCRREFDAAIGFEKRSHSPEMGTYLRTAHSIYSRIMAQSEPLGH